MKFPGTLRALLLTLVALLVVWACVVFWWQVTEIQPDGQQMLVWLGIFPAALLGGWWLTRAWLDRRRRKRRQVSQPGGESAPTIVQGNAEDRPRYQLDVFAEALQLPIADDPVLALTALHEAARPNLHPILRDHAGLPVFAAWVDSLDSQHWQEYWQDQFADHAALSEEQARAIGLLDPVAETLFIELLALLPPVADVEEKVVAGLRRLQQTGPVSRVRLCALLSQAWPPSLRQAVGDWLLEKAGECGLASVAHVHIDIVPVAGPTQAWQCLDRIGRGDDSADEWQVLLGCDSLLGERSVEALQASGLLMNGQRVEGVIPGEGAAGLVLRKSSAAVPAPASPGARIHTLVQGAAAASEQTRMAARSSSELLLHALAMTRAGTDQVSTVLSDADQRPSRCIEAAAAASHAFPELEPAGQHFALGAACGHLGHVAPLALLAVAAAKVRCDATGVIALGVAAIDKRAAIVLLPPTMQDAGAVPEAST